MPFTEKCCSYCGKITYDSVSGPYTQETHTRRDNGKEEKCDMNGTVYTSSGPDPLEEGN